MKIQRLGQKMAVCQLPAGESIPAWCQGEFTAVIRSPGELTVVCDQQQVPEHGLNSPLIRVELDWIGFVIDQVLDFGLVGVIAKLSRVMADANIPIFVISSYSTDYFLIRQSFCELAVGRLVAAGYEVGQNHD